MEFLKQKIKLFATPSIKQYHIWGKEKTKQNNGFKICRFCAYFAKQRLAIDTRNAIDIDFHIKTHI